MRVKLIVLAVGAGLALFALVWGRETVTQISEYRTETTLTRGGEVPGAEASAKSDEIPNIMKGGIDEVNKNLSGLKTKLQNTMDERPGRLDKQVERAK